jgi:hypothetical protein
MMEHFYTLIMDGFLVNSNNKLGYEPPNKEIISFFKPPIIKISNYMVEIMNGKDSSYFKKFLDICVQVYKILRENSHYIIYFLLIMSNIT